LASVSIPQLLILHTINQVMNKVFYKLFNPTCYLSNLSELSRAPEASDTTLTCWCWLGWMMTLSPPQLMSHIKSETLPAVPFSPFPPYYMNKVGVNTLYVYNYNIILW